MRIQLPNPYDKNFSVGYPVDCPNCGATIVLQSFHVGGKDVRYWTHPFKSGVIECNPTLDWPGISTNLRKLFFTLVKENPTIELDSIAALFLDMVGHLDIKMLSRWLDEAKRSNAALSNALSDTSLSDTIETDLNSVLSDCIEEIDEDAIDEDEMDALVRKYQACETQIKILKTKRTKIADKIAKRLIGVTK